MVRRVDGEVDGDNSVAVCVKNKKPGEHLHGSVRDGVHYGR